MNFKNIILASLLFSTSLVTNGLSQTKQRIEALKDNSEYVELIEQDNILAIKRDSISTIVDSMKKELSSLSGQEKENKTNEILNYEASLFDIRSRIGVVNSKIATIEQEYIIANMGSSNSENLSNSDSDENLSVAKLLDYSKIRNELTKTEAGILSKESGAVKQLDDAFDSIVECQTEMDNIQNLYSNTADKLTADSLKIAFDSLSNRVNSIDIASTQQWETIYNSKIDLYNRLLDKFIAPTTVIEHLNETSRDFRSEESQFDKEYIAPSLSRSLRQKLLLKEYELALANLLKLEVAKTNIEKEQKQIDKTIYDINKITLEPQDFIEYHDIQRVAAKAHSAKNPFGELEVPSKGEMHKVELATYTKPTQAYYLFKNVSPIVSQELVDGKTRYWAGSYATAEEADAASKTLNKLGMKTKVASWVNGINQSDSTLNHGEFMIEFKTYTVQVKNIISIYAPNKKLEDIEDEDGHTSYVLSPFATKSEATYVADIIGSDAEVSRISNK